MKNMINRIIRALITYFVYLGIDIFSSDWGKCDQSPIKYPHTDLYARLSIYRFCLCITLFFLLLASLTLFIPILYQQLIRIDKCPNMYTYTSRNHLRTYCASQFLNWNSTSEPGTDIEFSDQSQNPAYSEFLLWSVNRNMVKSESS